MVYIYGACLCTFGSAGERPISGSPLPPSGVYGAVADTTAPQHRANDAIDKSAFMHGHLDPNFSYRVALAIAKECPRIRTAEMGLQIFHLGQLPLTPMY